MPQNGNDFLPLGHYLYYLPDSSGNMDVYKVYEAITENKFIYYNSDKVFNRSYTKCSYWFYIIVSNTSKHQLELLYSIYDDLKYCRLYELQDKKKDSVLRKQNPFKLIYYPALNYATPLNKRPYPVRSLSYALKFNKNEIKHLLIKVDNTPQNLYAPMDICTLPDYLLWEMNYQRTYGWYFGIYSVAFIFSIILLIRLKKALFFWYALYILCWAFILLQEEFFICLISNDVAYAILSRLWQMIFVLFGLSASTKIIVQLSDINKTDILYKITQVAFYILILFAGLALSICLFDLTNRAKYYEYYFSTAGYLLASLVQVILIFILIKQSLRGNKLALYYLMGLLVFLLGCLNVYLNILSITNFTFISPNGITVGLTIEILVIGLLIANYYYKNLMQAKQMEIELKNEKLEISNQVIHTLEEERTRIGQDLHDDIGGTLSALKLNMTFNTNNEERTLHILDKAIADLRNISHKLMPLNFKIAGLNKSIRHYVQHIKHPQVEYVFSGDDTLIAIETQLTIYRIVLELFTNVIKHAQANNCTLQCIMFANFIRIFMEDDGVGFNANENKTGIGLKNIQNRVQQVNGKLQLQSNSQGTTVTIEIHF